MPQFQGPHSPLPSWSVLDRSLEQAACTSSSSQSMIDELQSPGSNKKRKTADSLPGQKRRLAKKTKIVADIDIAGPCALSQSPSRSSFNSSPTQTARIPSGKNAKAGPSTKPSATSQTRDLSTPTRVSSRVSRPTFKKKALLLVRKSRSPESDGTPPISIIPPPSLKRKKPTSSSTKRLAGNNTPSKSKWLDPNPIELTSSDDGSRTQPPQKRVKHTHKQPFSSQVINLCSESEDVIASSRRTRTRDEVSVVVVLSTDEEVDLKSPSLSHLAFGETDTRESPALPLLRDISPPIEVESLFQASPSPQAHDTPVPKPNAPAAEDGVTDENMYPEKANLPRGSLQALYNEALARCAPESQRAKDIADQLEPSPFSSLKCIPPARIIRYATKTQSPSLHTPLFFDRIVLRLRARLRQPKASDSKTFPDDTTFSDAKVVSDDTSLNSIQASKLNEEQEDSLAYSDTVMEISTVDSEVPEAATKITLVPPIDCQDDALSDTQATRISPSILVNNMDVNERPVSRYPESPSPLKNQESYLSPEVTMLEDTPVLDSIQVQKVSTNCRLATSDGTISSAISTNMLCNTSSDPSNSDAVNDQFETPQEFRTSLFGRENCGDQVATIEPIVLKDAQFFVQALQRKYDASNISGFLLKLNDTAKPSAAFEHLSESPTDYTMIPNTSSASVSSSELTSSASKYLFESSMMRSLHAISTTDVSLPSESSETPMILLTEQGRALDLSSPAGSSSKDVSSGFECLSEPPAIPNLSPLASSSSAGTLISRNSSPSTPSCQSLDSRTSIESVNCHLLTPDDSPSPLTSVKAQKPEPLICSNSFPSPVDVSLFDIEMSELNLQTLMGSKFDEDDDDDNISISGMELTYPEELHTI